VTPGQYLHLVGNSGLQAAWSLIDTLPLIPSYQNDWLSYFLFITASNSLSCADNSYVTEEHN
jgi:hypothetical protein